MVDEELKNKNVSVCTLKSEVLCNASIKECLDNLSYENINTLYERYDCLESEPMYKSIQARKNYLYREIVGEFIYSYGWWDIGQRKKIVKLYNQEQLDFDNDVIDFLYFGFIYITPSKKIVFPMELRFALKDLLIHKS